MPGWALHSGSSSGLPLEMDTSRVWEVAQPFCLWLAGREEGEKTHKYYVVP